MKNKFLAGLLLAFAIATAGGETPQQLDRMIDFGVTLKRLCSEPSLVTSLQGSGKLVLLTGSVESRVVLNPEPADFSGLLYLIMGEWNGTESVAMYRCAALLEGERFANSIPVRRSRTVHPDEIPTNSMVLVMASVADTIEDELLGSIPLVRVEYLRIIE